MQAAERLLSYRDDHQDIDLFEVNEAFAAIPMSFRDPRGRPGQAQRQRGAIALGHPVGSTGIRPRDGDRRVGAADQQTAMVAIHGGARHRRDHRADVTVALELTGLAGKVAVVTGAGRMRAIGRAIAVELARAGCDVVVTGTGRDPSRYPREERDVGWRDVESVAEEIRSLGRRATPAVLDVTDEDAVSALVDQVYAAYGRLDVVVNNAAAARGADRVPVVDLPVDVWDHVLRVNLRGTFLVSRRPPAAWWHRATAASSTSPRSAS